MDPIIAQNITPPSLWILMMLVPFICISRILCEKFAARAFVRFNIGQINKETKIWKRNLAIKKFQESFWKFSYYASVTLFALVTMSWEPFMLAPFYEFDQMAKGVAPMQFKLSAYYTTQISFYLWMTISLLWDVRRKDFYQMLIHHFSTLILLLFSYGSGLLHIGCIVMLVHDIADPFLELAKMFNYAKVELVSSAFFVSFMIVFLTSRLVFFPILVLRPGWVDAYPVLSRVHDNLYPYYVCNFLLWVLMVLNLMWAYTILKALVRKVTSGGKIKDDRSDEEEEE
ncbi:ceramide synthase 2-like isoform X2 [Convolutriloba macropyga]